jgi:hypothetical protein
MANRQDSRTQIILGLFTLMGAVGTALISNWDKIIPSQAQVSSPLPSVSVTPSPVASSSSPVPPVSMTEQRQAAIPSSSFNVAIQPTQPTQPTWKFFGKASTGESIFVESSSIKKSGENVDFNYRIGSERLTASAECGRSQWYVEKYGKWYSPSSQSTQDMLDYVCR